MKIEDQCSDWVDAAGTHVQCPDAVVIVLAAGIDNRCFCFFQVPGDLSVSRRWRSAGPGSAAPG